MFNDQKKTAKEGTHVQHTHTPERAWPPRLPNETPTDTTPNRGRMDSAGRHRMERHNATSQAKSKNKKKQKKTKKKHDQLIPSSQYSAPPGKKPEG
jgi:hypothetical protein